MARKTVWLAYVEQLGQPTIDARTLPSAGWTAIDLAAIWPTELRQLIDHDDYLQAALEAAVEEWIADGPEWLRRKYARKRWRYDDPRAEPPFFMTLTDGAVTHVDRLIDQAREKGDEDVALLDACSTILMGDLNLDRKPPPAVLRWADRTYNEIYKRFEPGRDSHLWCRPYHACFAWSAFTCRLAQAWSPGDWHIAAGPAHATVVDVANMRVFDIFITADDGPDEAVLFAQNSTWSKCVRSQRQLAARSLRLRKKREVAAALATGGILPAVPLPKHG